MNGREHLLLDLGYDDLGFRNGHKTFTPAINERVAEGIVLSHYHTYKVCGPSRASIMTGRYPWGIGYYDMTGTEAVSLEYTLIPEVLQACGWKTAAIGKVNPMPPRLVLVMMGVPKLTRPAYCVTLMRRSGTLGRGRSVTLRLSEVLAALWVTTMLR